MMDQCDGCGTEILECFSCFKMFCALCNHEMDCEWCGDPTCKDRLEEHLEGCLDYQESKGEKNGG